MVPIVQITNSVQRSYNPSAEAQQNSSSDPTLRTFDPHLRPIPGLDKPIFTADQIAQHLTRSGQKWNDSNGDGVTQVSYTFDTQGEGERAFNATQKNQARLSMQSWADVANVSFEERTDRGEGHLAFSNSEVPRVASAQLPGEDVKVLINPRFGTNAAPAINNHGRYTLTHEIGHGLGLLHPADYDNSNDSAYPSYFRDAVYAQDTRGHTVMSYFDADLSGQNHQGKYSAAPLMGDIAGVQRVYGANYRTRNSDTTYGFNSNSGRDYYQLDHPRDTAIFCVWDGGGNDTLDFSKYRQNQTINLNAESYSDVGGLRGNVSIAKGVTVENAIGGSGHDAIIGNDADNVLKGAAGADWLRGAGGADTFAYDHASDSTLENPDLIMDFVSGTDRIDISALLKNAGIGALTFVRRLSGEPGQAVLSYNRHANLSRLAIDLTGNGRFDFFLKSHGPINTPDIISNVPVKWAYS